MLSELDQNLVRLLSVNARTAVSELARELGVSRATVQSHIQQLEHRGIIQGYTLKLSKEFQRTMVEAHVWIATDQKKGAAITSKLKSMGDLLSLYSISGEFDLVAILRSRTTEDLDLAIDHISGLNGIVRTQTSVVLSTKFER
jgi:DNA-binding Lrp family transcriptional regulator